ncbi:MAG: sugar ABC transporter permease [Ardenticatenaceae bacterium]|nr:sugar ABC transporter permease [Ardenticatenaceae bacterium]HBY95335.1 sugar ABC transporter permease [Chloroflexota bacterium]
MAAGTAPTRYTPEASLLGRVLPWRRRNYLFALLFILPALINFTLFRYLPILAALRASLFNYSLLGGFRGFIGLDHYARLVHDPIFWKSLWVTTQFVIYKVPIEIVFALALAVFLQRETFGAGFVRSAIMAPMVTSIIVVSILWAMMYHSEQGLIQSMLNAVGIPRQAFLSDQRRALPALTVMMIWKDVGFSMIILAAGLKGIPSTYYEAALVDGANRWQAFWNVTIPLLKPILMFVIVTQTVFSFQIFVPVYQMTKGGPLDSTKAIVFYIYQQGFLFQDMGYASALSMVTLAILLVVSLAQMRLLRSEH